LSGGYDVFYGLIWGTRLAFKLGLAVALGRAFIGVLLGLLAGYAGGLLDRLIMRVTDAFMAVPVIAAALLMLVLLADAQPIILVLILFGWMPCARLVRGNVLVERGQEYIQAAIALGVPNRRIIFRHLAPNITCGLFALTTLDVGAALIWAATFYFIRLTGSPDGNVEADWGQMLSLARDWIVGPPAEALKYWYSYLPVSLALVLFSLGWSFIGDGLADALDPRRQLPATPPNVI
jgi:peptide/nickel transport system permease protein